MTLLTLSWQRPLKEFTTSGFSGFSGFSVNTYRMVLTGKSFLWIKTFFNYQNQVVKVNQAQSDPQFGLSDIS